jgi:methylated-DNA-[protein]-cysteine S-methyltransferase
MGTTISYGNLAYKLGNKKMAQAVGSANRKNPIAIVIPCHQVIGSDNSLTGYAGGLQRKEWLLKHEGTLLL